MIAEQHLVFLAVALIAATTITPIIQQWWTSHRWRRDFNSKEIGMFSKDTPIGLGPGFDSKCKLKSGEE